MNLNRKNIRPVFWVLAGGLLLLASQSIWIYHTYQLEHHRLMAELKESFTLAYEKEQTYRVPVVNIINPGGLSIQSCGNEEIIIVRTCLDTDTIVYNNISGHSIEKFINRAFRDLREDIVPMNIYCLSDLFAGMLHDKDIPVSFIIERYNTATDAILESTLLPNEERKETGYNNNTILAVEISEAESVRAIMLITPGIIFKNIVGTLLWTILLAGLVLFCFILPYWMAIRNKDVKPIENDDKPMQNPTYNIGKYTFDPLKNELQGFGETIQLNKKENSILHALCIQQGNVVERNTLLEENWGSNGFIYSRSLDTYFATLRKYLKKDSNIQIITIKGVGYKLVVPPNANKTNESAH